EEKRAMLRASLLASVTTLGLFVSESRAFPTTYDFLPVAPTGAFTSKFSSLNQNGYIDVTDAFPNGGEGSAENNNALITPSVFPNKFPNNPAIPGHLAQTVYNHTSIVTFDLTQYTITPQTVFGIWNITDEVQPGPGQTAVYNVQLLVN